MAAAGEAVRSANCRRTNRVKFVTLENFPETSDIGEGTQNCDHFSEIGLRCEWVV
jgi:hypothetical protein